MSKTAELQSGKRLKKKITKISDKYLDKVSPKLITYYNKLEKLDQDNEILKRRPPEHIATLTPLQKEILQEYLALEKELIDLLIIMMGEVYREVAKSIRRTYGDAHYHISKINFFNKDGLVLKDRLQKWLCPFQIRPNPSREDAEPYIDAYNDHFMIDKLSAINRMDVILYTECSFQAETVKRDKLSPLCEWVEICFGGGDCRSDCESLCGEYPSNEAPDPPFHSHCGCYAVWIQSDDPKDIEDLDLEDDIDEEEYYDDIDEELENVEIENAEESTEEE